MAKLFAVDIRRVNPIDERPPPAFVHRSGRTNNEDRAAVEISVVNSHRRMQHADDIVHNRHHRLAGRLGVAVRNLHRDLLVLTEQKWRIIAAVIDQRVVQPAVTGARIKRNIGKTVVLDQIDDNVRLPGFLGIARCRPRFRGDVVHWRCG
jgi:hypothetical protein